MTMPMPFCCARCGAMRDARDTATCPHCRLTNLVVPWPEFLPLKIGTIVRLWVEIPQDEPHDRNCRLSFRIDNDNEGEIVNWLRSTDNGEIIYKVLTAGVFGCRRDSDGQLWVHAREVEPIETDADEPK